MYTFICILPLLFLTISQQLPDITLIQITMSILLQYFIKQTLSIKNQLKNIFLGAVLPVARLPGSISLSFFFSFHLLFCLIASIRSSQIKCIPILVLMQRDLYTINCQITVLLPVLTCVDFLFIFIYHVADFITKITEYINLDTESKTITHLH